MTSGGTLEPWTLSVVDWTEIVLPDRRRAQHGDGGEPALPVSGVEPLAHDGDLLVGLAGDEIGARGLGDDDLRDSEMPRQRPHLALEQIAERVDRRGVVGMPG